LYGTAECAECGRARSAEFDVIRDALQESLTDLRAIAAGLRLPHMETGDFTNLIERTVLDHERRTHVSVNLKMTAPNEVPVPIKIALLRSLQEALSNASRHGLGRDVQVQIWSEGRSLTMEVKD